MSSAPLTTAGPTAAGPPGAVRGPRRLTAIVGVLSLAVFMSSLDLFIVNLAFPYIGRQYPGTSLSDLSWVLNGYTIVFAAVLVPAGGGLTGSAGGGCSSRAWLPSASARCCAAQPRACRR
jgi:MFS family permease